MPSRSTKRKKKKPTLPRWQVAGLVVLAVVLLATVIWYLMGGFEPDRTPFEQRLREIAVKRVGIIPILNQFFRHLFCFLTGSTEDDAVDLRVIVDDTFEGQISVF